MFNFSDQVLYGAELGNTRRWFGGVFYCALCGMKQKEALVQEVLDTVARPPQVRQDLEESASESVVVVRVEMTISLWRSYTYEEYCGRTWGLYTARRDSSRRPVHFDVRELLLAQSAFSYLGL